MKRLFKVSSVLTTAVALFFTWSCAKDLSDTSIDANTTPGAISFTESINSMATKATDTAFDTNDQISVSAYDSTGAVYASNVTYTFNGSIFTSSDPIMYGSDDAAQLSFRAIYPAVTLDAENKTVNFTIESDQSTGDNYTMSDLMSSYVEPTSSETPELTFKHILTKMIFKISSSDVELTNVVAKASTSTSIEYNIGTLFSSVTNDVSNVTMVDNGSDSYKAIILPQSYAAGDVLGVVTVNGVDYEIILNNALTVSAGVQYTYELSIIDGTITFDNPSINGWTVDVSNEEPAGDDYETSQTYVSSIEEFEALDLSALESGEVIVWKDGTYDTVNISISTSGSPSKPIILRAETPGGVIFTGSSTLTLDAGYIQVSGFWWKDPTQTDGSHLIKFGSSSTYCKVSDCAASAYNASEDYTNESKWVSVYGTNNTLTGCTLVEKRNEGCAVVVWLTEHNLAVNHTITNNYFERSKTLYDGGSSMNGQECIRIGDSAYSMTDSGCLIEGNHFYTCHGELNECISNKAGDNTYRNNLFENTQSSLSLRHGNNCVIEYNYFVGGGLSGTGGFRIIGENHVARYNYLHDINGSGNRGAMTISKGVPDSELNDYFQVKNAEIYGNVCVNSSYSFNVNYGSGDQTLGAIGTTIKDNIVYTTSSSDYFINYSSTDETDITWENNLFVGSGKFSTGISFDTTELTDEISAAIAYPTDAIQAIKDDAGCSWSVN